MVINRREITRRELRGLTIVGKKDQIIKINAVTFTVKSQTSDSWYVVTNIYKQGWACSCPDNTSRGKDCKHIHAVQIFKELQEKEELDSGADEIKTPNLEIVCKCGSSEIVKHGIRHNKSVDMQRFRCKKCNHKWSDNLGFAKAKIDSKIITIAIDLYFRGVSLRKICDHLKLFYGISISNVAVLGWIRKFAKVVSPFVDQLIPKNVSRVYHVDEMTVHVRKETNEKGHYQWLWNMMDNTTKFWISSKVSQRREVNDARTVFQDAKSKVPSPIAIVHDGLHSYNEAYWKEYYTMEGKRIKNIRSVSVRHKGLNQVVERLNGVMRDRERVMHGLDHADSAQKTIDAFRIHYNFIREHESIKKTPAEEAGIKLPLGQNKIQDLIKLASKNIQN